MVDGILTTPGSICLLLKLGHLSVHKLSPQILKPCSTPLLFPFSQPASRPNCLMGDTAGNYILVRADRCSVPICPLPHPKYIWWITQLKSVPSITTNQCNHGGSPGRGRVIGDKCRGQHFYITYLARILVSQYLATTLHIIRSSYASMLSRSSEPCTACVTYFLFLGNCNWPFY